MLIPYATLKTTSRTHRPLLISLILLFCLSFATDEACAATPRPPSPLWPGPHTFFGIARQSGLALDLTTPSGRDVACLLADFAELSFTASAQVSTENSDA
jgi:hypothetical protein